MSRLLKERTHRTHVPAPRAAQPAERLPAPPLSGAAAGPGPGPTAGPAASGVLGHRVVAVAVAAMLVATAVIWTASSLADGTTTTTPPAADVPFEYRPLTGGVPFGP